MSIAYAILLINRRSYKIKPVLEFEVCMTFSERLRAAMDYAGFTQGGLAKAVGMAQSSVNKLLNSADSSRKTVEIAKVLGVRPEWLSSGEGDMLSDRLREHSPAYSTVRESRLKAAVWEDMSDVQKQEFVEIPLLSINLSAGPGCEALEEDEEFTLSFRRHYLKSRNICEDDAKLVRVTGRSMEPMLNDGDVVGINIKDIEIRDGKTYAICQADLLRIKILIATPDSVIIRSINRDEYPDEIITRDKFHDEVRIIGKVFWSAHSW